MSTAFAPRLSLALSQVQTQEAPNLRNARGKLSHAKVAEWLVDLGYGVVFFGDGDPIYIAQMGKAVTRHIAIEPHSECVWFARMHDGPETLGVYRGALAELERAGVTVELAPDTSPDDFVYLR